LLPKALQEELLVLRKLFLSVVKVLFAKKKRRENITITKLRAYLATEEKRKHLVLSQGQLDSLVLA
jgi:hypothetical protein